MLPWNLKRLSLTPSMYPANAFHEEGVEAIFYEGLPYRGKPTRVFAWLGVPEGSDSVPGMVLVHGGGGTAFAEWVRLWNARGYAAIAMDVCGGVPVGEYANWQRHDASGPAGWEAGFAQIDEPVADQWPYHAVSAIALSHSLLRAQPSVDPARIGLTGISWGGYLTCLTAGVDHRFRFAAPVYGCGFLGDDSFWLPDFARMGSERAGRWLAQWDPSAHLSRAEMPMFWNSGTNDFAYPMSSLQKSYRLPAGPRTLCLPVNMIHDHAFNREGSAELHAFAEHLFNGGTPLATVTGQAIGEDRAEVTFTAAIPIIKAEFNYTRDSGTWQERQWTITEAALSDQCARASVPDGTTACYFNLFDARGLMVSSEHAEP